MNGHARILAVGMLTVVTMTAPTAAVGAPVDPPIRTDWAGPTLALDWQNQPQAVATESFIGTPVSVPGDRAGRTLTITNAAPGEGMLTVWITDVEISGSSDGLSDDLQLRWSSPSGSDSGTTSQLAAQSRCIAAGVIESGQSTQVTVEYLFPRSATSGNRSGAGPAQVNFTVTLRLDAGTRGGCAEEPSDGDDDDGDDGGATIDTGLLGLPVRQIAAGITAMLVGAGLMLVVLVRRRRRDADRPDGEVPEASAVEAPET